MCHDVNTSRWTLERLLVDTASYALIPGVYEDTEASSRVFKFKSWDQALVISGAEPLFDDLGYFEGPINFRLRRDDFTW